MGTRADFYIGRGPQARWLGSVAWDGYPDGILPQHGAWPEGQSLLDATTEADYLMRLERFLEGRDDATRPDQGWPWPWTDSRTTDYAYAFDGGAVWCSCFGRRWHNPLAERTEAEIDADGQHPKEPFPNMKDRQRVTLGARSGVIVVETGKTR